MPWRGQPLAQKCFSLRGKIASIKGGDLLEGQA